MTTGRVMAVITAGAVAVVAFLLLPAGSPGQVVAFCSPFVVAAALLARRLVGSTARSRSMLAPLWAGQLIYAVGMVVWFAVPVGGGHELPYPSAVDAAFLVSFALFAVFMLVLLRRDAADRQAESRLAFTDSLIVTASAMAVVWVLVIEPVVAARHGVAELAVTVMYPAANLVLLALATRLAVFGRFRRTQPGILLLTWITAELLGDVLYGAQVAGGTFEHTGPLTVSWMVAYTALGALAAHPRLPVLLERPPGDARPTAASPAGRWVRHALLLAATLVPLGLIALYPEHSTLLVAIAILTSVLVSARFLLLTGDLGEQRRLAVELEAALEELRHRNADLARYAAIVASTDDSVITVAPDGRIEQWNRGARRLFGYSSAEIVGRPVGVLVAPESRTTLGAAYERLRAEQHVSLESVALRRDGTTVPMLVTLSTILRDDGDLLAVVAIGRDITDRKQIEAQLAAHAEQMQRMAFEDPLTGLGNRALFLRRVADLGTATGDAGGCDASEVAVIMLDLDDFKVVNDSLGHETGDALLAAAATRLGDVVGEAGTVTRLGGDEFTVLLPDGGEPAATALAEQILVAFGRDFHVLGLALRTTTSIGITTGAAGADATSLLRSADLAMYAAKAAGKGTVHVYREELLLQAQERLRLESHLRHAAQREELRLEYQPIVDARTGTLGGLEALVRWDHPAWGTVSPATFIPVAEASGTILVIGEWVLRTACRQAVSFAAQHGQVGMSVNVSVRQLHTEGFVDMVRDALATSGLAPSLLTLEVTESLFLSEDPAVTAALDELGAMGVHLSIDDFGTGHSALARLQVLPVSELKIDRSFVRGIGDDGECGPLIEAILAMARALDLSVVAEGVETPAQRDALLRAGCDRLQGFLLARPMPPARLRELGVAAVEATG